MDEKTQVKAPKIDQIVEIWREVGRLWAKISEIESIIRDASDGLYRRKILKTKEKEPEEEDEFSEIMKIVDAIDKRRTPPSGDLPKP